MEKKPTEKDMEYLDKWTRRSAITHSISDERLIEICNAERHGKCVVVTRCCECKNHSDIDGEHWCKFWNMYCPDDSEFYCKAANPR